MAFIPVLNTAEVQLIYSYLGQRMENTLYFKHESGSITYPDLVELGEVMKDWWLAHLGQHQSAFLSLEKVVAQDLSSSISGLVEITDDLPSAGIESADPLPLTDAVLVEFKTFTRGRSYRGRNFVPGITEGGQSGGVVSSPLRAALQADYEAIFLPTEEAGWDWVVVSRYTLGAPRVSGITTPIEMVATSEYIVTQRRRRQGAGS